MFELNRPPGAEANSVASLVAINAEDNSHISNSISIEEPQDGQLGHMEKESDSD